MITDARGAPLEIGDTVRVTAIGYGARTNDVGRRGTLTGQGRTRAIVALDEGNGMPAETRTIHPRCLRRTIFAGSGQ
jgi:hypothetical protein